MNNGLGNRSVFADVSASPSYEIPNLVRKARADCSPLKVDLSAGTFKDEEGKDWVPPIVRQVEQDLVRDPCRSYVYNMTLGQAAFCEAATSLLLGGDSARARDGRAFGIQCLGGTGALRIASEFVSRILGIETAYIPNPTWINHAPILRYAGFKAIREYRYWGPEQCNLDIDGLLQDLRSADPGSLVLLQVCAHNPTGVDPTPSQWSRIADACQERRLLPLFDCAYQGLATGDLDRDAYPVRMFASRDMEWLCGQSFSKIFGLYSERVGNLVINCNDVSRASDIRTHISLLVTPMYLNPPTHGCRIVARILTDPDLRHQWQDGVGQMAGRLQRVRHSLYQKLVQPASDSQRWDHVVQQLGMFWYTGLTEDQVAFLVNEKHIYLLSSGRISVCGLNEQNVDHVADSLREAVAKNSFEQRHRDKDEF